MGGQLKNRVRLSITLDPAMEQRVRALAKLQNVTISEAIEEVLKRGIKEAEVRGHALRDPLIGAVIDEFLTPDNLERARSILKVRETREERKNAPNEVLAESKNAKGNSA
jgi:hypothetical protein